MEQHPVPQNISSFQFKLIGDITLKQFAYVACGIIIGYILTKFSLIPSIIRYAFAAISAVLGFGLAFVPIEQRPMDRWLIAFFKSIYLPTQYVWKKQNSVPDVLASSHPIMQTVPAPTTPSLNTQPTPTSAPTPPPEPKPEPEPVKPQPIPTPPPMPAIPVTKPTPPVAEMPPQRPAPPPMPPVAGTISTTWAPQPLPAPVSFKPAAPKTPDNNWSLGAPSVKAHVSISSHLGLKRNTPAETPKPDAQQSKTNSQVERLKNDYQELEKDLNSQMKAMQEEMEKGRVDKDRFIQLQQLLTQLIAEKDRLSSELIQTKKQLETSKINAVKPTVYTRSVAQENPTVKIVPQNVAQKIGVPQFPTYPNVIAGIVKDGTGNLLPNIIITVKDKEGLPVRALKTNNLGQFASSTALPIGTYIIELEDPKKMFQFQAIEITLKNQILPPLEIRAVSTKDLMRQKLSEEIFGKNGI